VIAHFHLSYYLSIASPQTNKMLFNKTILMAIAGFLVEANASPGVLEARATNTALQTKFPASTGSTALAAAKTIAAGASFDGGMKKWDRSG
jgi:hypothetical protein